MLANAAAPPPPQQVHAKCLSHNQTELNVWLSGAASDEEQGPLVSKRRKWAVQRKGCDWATCLAEGNGEWKSNYSRPLYAKLSPDRFIANFNASKYFWGHCGVKRYDHAWVPTCKCDFPRPMDLVADFLDQFAGKHVLFVGDSVHGQFFTSLAHILGFTSSEEGVGGCPDPRPFMPHGLFWSHIYPSCRQPFVQTGKCKSARLRGEQPHAHEFDMRVRTPGPTLQYLRNEALVSVDAYPPNRTRYMCRWLPAASEADVIVLHKAHHDDNVTTLQASLSALDAARKPGATMVFIGAHSARCSQCVLEGKLTIDSVLAADAVMAKYNYQRLPEFNRVARKLTESYARSLYLDVFTASHANGKHRFSAPMDCLHQCLPGPMDQWSLLLMALLLSERPDN